MIHPSYVELMAVVNDDAVIGEEPVVNSRYSIVCAAAKRARQLIDGSDPLIPDRLAYGRKPLSIAVDELSDGNLRILTKDEARNEQEKLDQMIEKTKEERELVEAKREKEAKESPADEKPKKSSRQKSAKAKAQSAIEESQEALADANAGYEVEEDPGEAVEEIPAAGVDISEDGGSDDLSDDSDE